MVAVVGPNAPDADDHWAWTEDFDEAVFSVLNLDHDRFLSEIGQRNDEQEGRDVDVGDVVDVLRPSPGVGEGDMGTTATVSPSRGLRVRQRIAADVAQGKGCDMLRANIRAQRRRSLAPVATATEWSSEALCRVERAARAVQSAWRRFVLRHVFLHVREVVRQFSTISARAALQAVNPREAHLADAASDIVVRFRLAADQGSPLPVVVYKVFTLRPVVDVCRGGLSQRDTLGAQRASTALALRVRGRRGAGCAECRSWSEGAVGLLLFASYKRVENNPWRPCPAGLFDPDRCPARGQGASRPRPPRPPPRPPSVLVKAATTVKKKLSSQERERACKIDQLRRMYGYDRGQTDFECPPPPPSLSSKSNTFLVLDEPDDGGLVVVEEASPGDAYYDRLIAAWEK